MVTGVVGGEVQSANTRDAEEVPADSRISLRQLLHRRGSKFETLIFS